MKRSRLGLLVAVLAVVAVTIVLTKRQAVEPLPAANSENPAASRTAAVAIPRGADEAAGPAALSITRPDPENILKRVRDTYLGTGKPSGTHALAGSLDKHLAEAKKLLKEFETADPQRAPRFNQLLEAKLAELEVLRDEADRWIAANVDKGSDFQGQVQDRFDRVRTALEAVKEASSGEERGLALRSAQRTLVALSPPRAADRVSTEPNFIQVEPPEFNSPPLSPAPPPAYINQGQETSSNTPSPSEAEQKPAASHLPSFGVAEAHAADTPPAGPPPEAQTCNYTSADLESALPEIDVAHPEITALAAQLHYSPLEIYSYVKNTIRFQPYYGSMKGALGTLKSGSGNDTDQASLLIALLRVSKIPARYVKGDAMFTNDDPRFLNWIGGKTATAVTTRISANGGMAGGITGITSSYFRHVWAEACVPYDNYRGSGADASGHHWIPLDASFKEMQYKDGDVAPEGFRFDYNGYLSERTHVMPHEALQDQVEAALGRALEGVGYHGEIVPQQIDVLPTTLPFEVFRFVNWTGTSKPDISALPTAHRRIAAFDLKNAAEDLLVPRLTHSLPELATARLTLSFKGATSADQARIDTWQQAGGDFSCGNTTNVYGVFRKDGVDITPAGTLRSVDICTDSNKLTITVPMLEETRLEWGVAASCNSNPYLGECAFNQVNYTNIGARNHHALQVFAHQASEQLIEERINLLLNNMETKPLPETDAVLGEYLHIAGLKYMDHITRGSTTVGRLFGGTGDSGNHIGLTSTTMQVDYLFDLPLAIAGTKGFLVDVPGGRSTSTSITTGETNYDAFILSFFNASAYESYIWQEFAQLDAVSTVRGIQFARETGVPVVELFSSADVDSRLNQGCATSPVNLNYHEDLKTRIKGQFSEGFQKITAPVCLIHYEDYVGYVYAAEGITQGIYGPIFQALYAISPDLAGGYTVGDPVANAYNPVLDTGYREPLSSLEFNRLTIDSTANVTLVLPALASGHNTGWTPYTTPGGDPVNLVSGNMYHRERDLALKGRGGLDFALERFYNSHVRKDGPFGFGWTHSLNHRLEFIDDKQTPNGVTNKVAWVDGTGALTIFQVAATASGVTLNQPFTNDAGVYVTARRETGGAYSIREKNGLTFQFENIAGTPGQRAKLTRIVDRNGNALALNYASDKLATVTDDLNRSLSFYYDNNDQHITRVVDWSGRTFRYTYLDNNLVRFETPLAIAGKQPATTYAYYTTTDGENLNHAMRSFTLPNGSGMTFEYYTNGRVFRHINSLQQTFTFRYNKFRRETTTTDERGITQTYLFNERGQQIEHVLGDGARMRYEYTDAANPLSETARRNQLGYRSQFTYDASGNLTRRTLPDGSAIDYLDFNSFHQPQKTRDANGNYTLLRYDAAGNLTDTIALKDGVNTNTPTATQILAWSKNTYDDKGNLKTTQRLRDFTAQTGPFVEYVYDANKLNPVTVKRCGLQQNDAGVLADQCFSVDQTFDALGRPTVTAGADLYVSSLQYDENGRVRRATDATNRWRDYQYDGNNNLLAESLIGMRAPGKVAPLVHNAIDYDVLDRPVRATDVAGAETHTAYDAAGNVIEVVDPDGYTVRFEYDAMNRPLRAFDEQGHAVVTAYDAGGRPVAVTDPNGNTTRYGYYGAAENGRLQRVTAPDNRWVEYFYDNNGNIVRTLDNLGRESLTSYDALNRPVRKVGPVHDSGDLANVRQVTRHAYNELGYVVTISAGYANAAADPGSEQLRAQAIYAYDDFSRRVSATDALGAVTRFVYDRHGKLVRQELPNGHLVAYTYDHARNGLLVQRTARLAAGDPDPQVATWKYNDLGQVIEAASPETGYDYVYDQANRIASVTDSRGGKALSYDYSPGGLVNSMSDSEGKRTDYLYDAAGRLTNIYAPGGDRVSFLFDAGGRLLEKHLPNGVESRYRYDAGNKLLEVVNRAAGGELSRHEYTYDAAGRRAGYTENISGGTAAYVYAYDALNRLKSVTKDGALEEAYTYDQFDNRLTRSQSGASTLYSLYDDAHQLTEVRSGSKTGPLAAGFVYDAAGNQVKKCEGGAVTRGAADCSGSETLALAYDGLERLTLARKSGLPEERYGFDHEGRRVRKTVGAATTQYLYSGMQIWAEYGGSWDAALARYTYSGLDQPLLRGTATETVYYHHDGLGSVVAMSGTSGAATATRRYDAWGNTIAATGGTVPLYGYTSREPDATGLIHYRARSYDPAYGRFTQRDPAGFADGVNPYGYVGMSPVNFVDPLGLMREDPGGGNIPSYPGFTTILWEELKATPGRMLPTFLNNLAGPDRALDATARFFGADALDTPEERIAAAASTPFPADDILVGASSVLGKASRLTGAAKGVSGLSDDIAQTFANGRYHTKVLQQDVTAYRYSGGVSSPTGRFLTTQQTVEQIGSPAEAQRLLNLPSGATAEQLNAFVIPKGTSIYYGRVAGGGPTATQLFIQDPSVLRAVAP